MVKDIAEGYTLLSKPKMKRFTVNDLQRLKEEIDNTVRNLRGDAPDAADYMAIQKHNRKIQRLMSANRMIQTEMQDKRRRGGR